MKNYQKFGLLLGLISAPAINAVTLKWDPAPAGQGVTGYNVYQSPPATTNWVLLGSSGTTNFVDVVGLRGTRYYVTSTNSYGESLPSNVVTNMLPDGPLNLRLSLEISIP